MSRVLAELLETSEPELSGVLHRLEELSGRPGVDVRLIAELAATSYQKTRELGLDPRDTTGKELYHALQALVAQHDIFLAQQIGARDASNVSEVLPKIVKSIASIPMSKRCWAIKHSVAKRMLKASPPKKVMKQLGYRSVDSLLKREQIGEIMCAIRFAESAAWQAKLIKQYRHLKPADFEARDIELRLLDETRWGSLAEDYIYERHHNLVHVKEHGVVLVLPLPAERMKGLCVTVMPLILHYINEIRVYSSLFKLSQVKPDFGDIIATTIVDDASKAVNMAGQDVHWRTVHNHFGKKRRIHPDEFQPHVQPEDLYNRKAEDVLYRLEPALKFWENLDYVLQPRSGEAPVSLGLLDNAISYCNGLEYGHNVLRHAQKSLWNEVLLRYMGQESLEQQVLAQLSNELIEPEMAGAL